MTTRQQRPPRSARNKMMDLLARRDHSEKELRKKLKEREFSSEEIEKALQYGREHNWLPETPDQELKLAEKMAHGLHNKGKGINFINQYLKEKGLPPIAQDPDLELEKARSLLKNKKFKADDKAKSMRFLAGRGFSFEIIRQAMKKE